MRKREGWDGVQLVAKNQKLDIPQEQIRFSAAGKQIYLSAAPRWSPPIHLPFRQSFFENLFQKKTRRMSVAKSELVSLGLQFIASFFWGIGASLAGPSTVADYLQLFAAVAWCLANCASAWHICAASSSPMSPAKTKSAHGEQNLEMASTVWMVLTMFWTMQSQLPRKRKLKEQLWNSHVHLINPFVD